MGWKKKDGQKGDRAKAFERLRSSEYGGLETITLRNGAEMTINPLKHFLLQKEYRNPELKNVLLRKIAKFALGDVEKTKKKNSVSAEVSIETN